MSSPTQSGERTPRWSTSMPSDTSNHARLGPNDITNSGSVVGRKHLTARRGTSRGLRLWDSMFWYGECGDADPPGLAFAWIAPAWAG